MKYSNVFIGLLFLTSCTSLGQLGFEAKEPSKNDTIFIFGVSPENINVIVRPGKFVDGNFIHNAGPPATLVGNPKDGYIIGRAKTGSVQALIYVQIAKKGELVYNRLKACDGKKTLSFTAPAGKVIYLGDLKFDQLDGKLVDRYSTDFLKAKLYIDTNFVNLKGRLEEFEPVFAPATSSCVEFSL